MKLLLCITLNTSLKHFADNPPFPSISFRVRLGQMTSVENIDLNGDACSSLSKSVGSPSVEENNTLFCRSLRKCHYTSCLRPNAHRSHSAGWLKLAETHSRTLTHTHTHRMTPSCIVGGFLIRCNADFPTIYSKWSHDDK